MQQYLHLLQEIRTKGTHKPAARENMPGTTSLFGYQFRHNLQDGFPILTTKKLSFKNIVVELLWFLQGKTNVKYLVDNGCNIWNEDAYHYYNKFITKYCEEMGGEPPFGIVHEDIQGSKLRPYTFEEFVDILKTTPFDLLPSEGGRYVLGDCGKQYGWLWRNYEGTRAPEIISIKTDDLSEEDLQAFRKAWEESFKTNKSLIVDSSLEPQYLGKGVDQLKELIDGLLKNPMSRRHIITAWNPVTLDDMALNACHALVQFNCRPLTFEEKIDWAKKNIHPDYFENLYITELAASDKCPKYYLDCQMYQRSADVFLGVPYNIASYALLTHLIARVTKMLPGDFIHTFGDVHIYDDHIEAVSEQLGREPSKLPDLLFRDTLHYRADILNEKGIEFLDTFVDDLEIDEFKLEDYNPQPSIKAKLSTGLK